MSNLRLSQGLKPVPHSASVHHSNPFLSIERQSNQIQRHLQTLLDAQSAGLSAGLQAVSQTDAISTGSSTPTRSQLSGRKSALTVPVRQPPEKRIGLQSARRRILRSIHNLLELKEDEHRIVSSELTARQRAMKEVDVFRNKRAGLEKSISEIENGHQRVREDELSNELQTLKTEIDELETKLAEMKARYRRAADEISQIQNSVDAELSSYREALSLVNSDEQQYLCNPPIQEPIFTDVPSDSTFYDLHPSRKTLDVATNHWRHEVINLRSRQRKVDGEIHALKEGGKVWNTVVTMVANFEKVLRNEMNKVPGADTSSEPPSRPSTKMNVSSILGKLDDVTANLEESLQLAEQNEWKLLICSIGAELEAFKQARRTFVDSFCNNDDTDDQRGTMVGEVPEDLLNALTPLSDSPPSPAVSNNNSKAIKDDTKLYSPSDDDEPDPAWLL